MRVLVLRPQRSAERTATRLLERGHEPVLLPLAEPRHDPAAARTALAGQHAAIAVTSGEAVRTLSLLGQDLDRYLGETVFCVGRATARCAMEAGFRSVLTSGGDGHDLAALIVRHFHGPSAPAKPLLYLAGSPRSPGFETDLAIAGVACRTVECYRMEPVAPLPDVIRAAVIDNLPEAILLYSTEQARRFLSLPLVGDGPERFDGTRFCCISTAVAGSLPKHLRPLALIAARPEEQSLLDLL